MPLLSWLARSWILSRILGRRRRRGYGYGYGGRSRGRGGLFPFPYYSTRTRRGSRVTVSGCCLPIPLALVVALLGAGRAFLRR